jgi:hypothetical protein
MGVPPYRKETLVFQGFFSIWAVVSWMPRAKVGKKTRETQGGAPCQKRSGVQALPLEKGAFLAGLIQHLPR